MSIHAIHFFFPMSLFLPLLIAGEQAVPGVPDNFQVVVSTHVTSCFLGALFISSGSEGVAAFDDDIHEDIGSAF